MQTKENRKVGLMDSSTVVTARRALGITKTYVVIAIAFSVIAITLWGSVMYVDSGTNSTSNSTTSNALVANVVTHSGLFSSKNSSTESGLPLLAVPLDMVPLLMIATPVVLLFVYDKNNGVLEYLLSLGMTQQDIYMRYLKAALLLAFIFSIIYVPATLAYGYETHGAAAVAKIFPIPLLSVPFALAVVGLMVIAMMAFSSLQKTRAGGNQPLGLIVGWACTIPGYIVPFIFTFSDGIYADLAIVVIMAIVVSIFLKSSGKLIRREKLLP